ncbi:sulfotransferase [Undibacterium sp. TJN25]|uniref:sulfotransferase n=1 Tax=Undibacterium sp. TJN25 TaxID=3413056 RepID=UPI003BF4153A
MSTVNITDLLKDALSKQQAGDIETAKNLYRCVLQTQPRNADAHHLLGCIYGLEHNLNSAIASIDTAISINPEQAIFYSSLGTCYLEKNEHIAAELCFRRAAEISPKDARGWENLGSILISGLRFGEARTVLLKANGLVPGHDGIMCNLAWAHVGLGRSQEALEIYQDVIKVNPSSAVALMGMAICMNNLQQPKAAIVLIEQVMELGAFTDKAMQIKGVALSALGRIDEAIHCYDSALEKEPTSAHLLLSRVELRKVQKEEPFFKHLLQIEDQADRIHGNARTQLFYALGKAYQDTGDIAAAAGSYAVGAFNHAMIFQYNEADDIARESAIQECMTEDCLKTLKCAGMESDRPIFILGMPRSGTTLIEQMLASHPEVAAMGELTFINEVLDGAVIPGGWLLEFETANKLPASATFRERAEAYLKKVDEFSPLAKGKRFTDKMPANYLNIGLILALFPNAYIIHCRRDPIDTCISCYTTLFSARQYWSYDLGVLGRTYQRYWSLMQHWRSVLPGRIMEVRYEQVVLDPEQTARKLLAWCGLEWDPGVLKFHETERPVMTASVAQVREPMYQTSVGRWKKWTPYIQPLLAEIQDIEHQYWAELNNG